jgi:uncharacterized membrane protein
MERRPRQVITLSIAVILFNMLGNTCLSLGMRSIGSTDYVAAFLNPWVLGGIALLIAWLVSQLSLLSWADLTYVLPISAASYVGSALMGRFGLGEHVSNWRWSGVALIGVGILIVGRTRPRTEPTR